jgi:hypothetical protein
LTLSAATTANQNSKIGMENSRTKRGIAGWAPTWRLEAVFSVTGMTTPREEPFRPRSFIFGSDL